MQGQQGQKLQHRAGFHRLVPLTNNLALETKGPARKVMVPESATPRPESVREWKVPSRTEMALWGPSCSRVPSSHQWASGPPARDTSQENVATSPAKTSTCCKPRIRHGAASVQEGERRGAGATLRSTMLEAAWGWGLEIYPGQLAHLAHRMRREDHP